MKSVAINGKIEFLLGWISPNLEYILKKYNKTDVTASTNIHKSKG